MAKTETAERPTTVVHEHVIYPPGSDHDREWRKAFTVNDDGEIVKASSGTPAAGKRVNK